MCCISFSRNICTQKRHAYYTRANVNCLVERHPSAIDGCLSWSIKSAHLESFITRHLSPSEIFQIRLLPIPVLILVYISYTPLFRQAVSSFTGLATKILCALHVPTTRAAWPGRLLILDVNSLRRLGEEYKLWSPALFLHSSLNPF